MVMRGLRFLLIATVGVTFTQVQGQNLDNVNRLWHMTVSAVQSGDADAANAEFVAFDSAARVYVQTHGRDWQIEYLVGSIDCLFPEKRALGAEFLQDLLQNSQSLSDDGKKAVRSQLAGCQSGTRSATLAATLSLPRNMADAYTHYQLPGVHGDMKGGFIAEDGARESSVVNPVSTETLLARRVSLDSPEKALQQALTIYPEGAKGAVVGPFAVVTTPYTQADAKDIGMCLENYRELLKKQFQIDSPQYMVTAYAVAHDTDVYHVARQLHGLTLPFGVLAYSVGDDMTLVAPVFGPEMCGSMAHELVHLLIKQRFPGAPAWLEEGLASEVAIANLSAGGLRFGWSWRDRTLEEHFAGRSPFAASLGMRTTGLRPTVAELLELPWSAFNSDRLSGLQKAQANQAMAAVFIRYLDAKGKLSAVYFETRDKHVSADLAGFESYKAVIEGNLGMPLSAVDADFIRWFFEEERLH